ncbi:MAG: TRAP transporter small permease subunit [Candidatus Moduliflexus flocculans]|nr:TRAP transporter small permease subunit [Candidatus Moduliflexus flocculans]
MSMKVGHAVKYLIPALICVLFFEVVSRYVFDKPTIWALETSMMIFGSIGALCWGYTLKIGGHVRVDVFYSMLSKWWKAFIDVVLTLLFLFPFQLILIKTGIKWSLFALKTGEKMVESSWLPPIGAVPHRADDRVHPVLHSGHIGVHQELLLPGPQRGS